MHKFFITAFIVFCANGVFAQSPIEPVFKYFSGLLDETKAEIAVGEMMEKAFIESASETFKIERNESLTKRMAELAKKSNRNNLNYKVYIIESDIADEILLPNGTVFFTTKLLSYATTLYQQDFLLGRNVIHMAHKHPIKLLKSSGVYPALLKQLKLPIDKRNSYKIIMAIREYLVHLGTMEYEKADLDGIRLTHDPEKTRISAIEMLEKFKPSVWPAMSINYIDIPQRIKLLKEYKAQ